MKMDVVRMLFVSMVVLCSVFQFSTSTVFSLKDTISTRDFVRMRKLFTGPIQDLPTAYQISKGLSLMGFESSDANIKAKLCQMSQNKVDVSDVESLFYASSVMISLGPSCKVNFNVGEAESTLKSSLISGASSETIFHSVKTLINLGLKLDTKAILPILNSAVEEEETSVSLGRAFHIGAVLPEIGSLTELFEQVEDAVARADETSDTLYFESLEATSLVITGIFALADHIGKSPLINEEQATKFGNYIVLSKYATTISDAFHVVSAATVLATNKIVVPTAILPLETRPISYSNQDIVVQLTDIFGGEVDGIVNVRKLENPDGVVEVINKPMKKSNGVAHSYPLFSDISQPGEYIITLSTESKKDSHLVDLPSVNINVMVSYKLAVEGAAVSVIDKDQGISTMSFSVKYPQKAPDVVNVDSHSKFVVSFSLKNMNTSIFVTVHQAFVKFSVGDREIFYVAEVDGTEVYKVEIDVSKVASDFNQISGLYDVSLIGGDFAVENQLLWHVCTVNFKFPGSPVAEKERSDAFMPKPVIQHLFTPAEKRPSVAISQSFTVLVLTPLGLLLILWYILGANISNLGKRGIWSILFHIGLAGVFALYYFFWIKLNMFQTLQYLCLLGIITFLAGNRMLKKVANDGKQN